MAIKDLFGGNADKYNTNESNQVFGQATLGNNAILVAGNPHYRGGILQNIYVTTSAINEAGRVIDVSLLTRNSTVMTCVNLKARAISQLPIKVMCELPDGRKVDALRSKDVTDRERKQAQSVRNLLKNPNDFQVASDFWKQLVMWQDLTGEGFVIWIRKDMEKQSEFPKQMFVLDSTLISSGVSSMLTPQYILSSPAYGYQKGATLSHYQVMHLKEIPWQGDAGFNKGTQAVELISLDQDIDILSNYVMLNSPKITGTFTTEQILPDGKLKELKDRIAQGFAKLVGRDATDKSKAGQAIILDGGMSYQKLELPSLQDQDIAKLKQMTTARICALFGVPVHMLGLSEGKFNNTQSLLQEFYKTGLYPMLVNMQEHLDRQLLRGYPTLSIEFDTSHFLKGSPKEQMEYAVAGVSGGILTVNEARCHIGMEAMDGQDELKDPSENKPMNGTSPQDTGGGGGPSLGNTNMPSVGADES